MGVAEQGMGELPEGGINRPAGRPQNASEQEGARARYRENGGVRAQILKELKAEADALFAVAGALLNAGQLTPEDITALKSLRKVRNTPTAGVDRLKARLWAMRSKTIELKARLADEEIATSDLPPVELDELEAEIGQPLAAEVQGLYGEPMITAPTPTPAIGDPAPDSDPSRGVVPPPVRLQSHQEEEAGRLEAGENGGLDDPHDLTTVEGAGPGPSGLEGTTGSDVAQPEAEGTGPAARTSAPAEAQAIVPRRQRALLATLPDHAKRTYAIKSRLIQLVEEGASAIQALSQLKTEFPGDPVEMSTSWAQKTIKRYKEEGWVSFLDQRQHNKRLKVYPQAVSDLLQTLYLGWTKAGPSALWRELKVACERENLPVPSLSWVKAYMRHQPPLVKHLRKEGVDAFRRDVRITLPGPMATYPGEEYQIDHTPLDIWVRVSGPNEEIKAARAFLTIVLDQFSRAIVGYSLSLRQPDAWTCGIAVYHALAPKKGLDWPMYGAPTRLVTDRGKDFLSRQFCLALDTIGVKREVCAPRAPNEKSQCERFFRTFHDGRLSTLPGYTKQVGGGAEDWKAEARSLLTLSELRTKLESFITESYHHDRHTTLKRSPAEAWGTPARVRALEAEELDLFLLQADSRTVTNKGIQFKSGSGGGFYWAPELTPHWNKPIVVRFYPDDFDSILVFDAANGQFICEAFLIGSRGNPYPVKTIAAIRLQQGRSWRKKFRDARDEVLRVDRKPKRLPPAPPPTAPAAAAVSAVPTPAPSPSVASLMRELRDL